MPASLLEYQLRIRNASTTGDPNGTADYLVLSSVPSATFPYIAAAPSGDGQEVDPITGALRTGAYTVDVVDATTGTDATGTIRVLTSRLEDATFRQQLLSRRAYLEVRTDGGAWTMLVAGFITGVRLVSPMRYAITVGDSRRVEQSQTIFQGASLGTYTTRGCFVGGPVTADWGPLKTRGGWQYRWTNVGTNLWRAVFQRGYSVTANAPSVTDWRKVLHPRAVQVMTTYVQPNPYPSTGAAVTYDFAFTTLDETGAVADGVVAYIGSTNTNAVATNAVLVESSEAYDSLDEGELIFYWPSCPYASGTTVFISLTTAVPNANCPLYVDAHPVDLTTAIWDNARIQWNAAAAASIKTLIGENVRIACRFTEPPRIAEFLEKAIFGPFGIAARVNTLGEQRLFSTRIRDTTPVAVLSTTDLRSSEPLVFDLDEQTAVSSITLRQQVFQQAQATYESTPNGYQPADLNSIPLDGVNVQEVRQTSQYLDPNLTVFTGRNITYDIPGMIHTAEDWAPATTAALDAIALDIFDRFGRGCQTSEAQVLAGTFAANVQVGDEVQYDVAHFPNKGYRIGESSVGARIMQVVRRTETPAGPVFKLLDSGLAAQAATAPTITIAQNPNAPSSVAQFTIANAATLNATGVISVRVEWATGATTPTGGADVARYAPNAIPTGAVDLPAVRTPGTVVWVRARSEQAGRRPSSWTAWTSVTLATVAAPSSLTTSALKQTAVTLAWTNTSTTLPLAVFAFQGGSAPASWLPYRVGTLPVGSTSTVVRTLTGPSIAWTLGVAYETPNGLGSFATATVTTNSTLDTATRPAALAVIAGVDDASLTQGVALALWPSDQTLDLVIERSTTSGSGYAEIARVSGTTPVYVDQRPRDGVTYYYRAAHALGGYTLSPYTTVVSSTATGVPRDLVRPGAVVPTVVVGTTEIGSTGTVTLTITDPQNRVTQVRFRTNTNNAGWTAWTVVSAPPYQQAVAIPTTGYVQVEYEVTGFDADGVARVLAGGIESFDSNSAANIVSASGTYSLAGALTIAVQGDTDTNSFRYALASSPWASDAAAFSAAQAGTLVNARNQTLTFAGPYAVGGTMYLAIAAYTGASGSGSVSGPYRYAFLNGSRDTIPLTGRARIITTTATDVTVRYAVACPVAPSPNIASITYSTIGLATVAPTSPQTVTPELSDTVSEAAGSYVDFTVPRPAVGNPPGRITFSCSATARVADTDSVDVPAQDIIGPSLKIVTTPSSGSYALVITWDGTIVYNLDGASQSVSGWTSPRTVTITRNDYLGATQVAAFAVTKDGSTISESINVPPKDNSGASITIGTQYADNTTNIYTFTWSTSGMPTGTTYDLIYTTTTTAGVVEQGVLNNQTSPVDVTSGYSIGLTPKYQMTINAIKDGTLVLTKSRAGTFFV